MDRLTERVFAFDGTSCMQIKACGNDTCDETCMKQDGAKGCGGCPIQTAIDKLAEYEGLEEQGKLLKLPCAVGNTVYTNVSMKGWYFRERNKPYEARIVFVGINRADDFMNVDFGNGRMLQFKFSDIGKTVFLTKEEAEVALKELQKEDK